MATRKRASSRSTRSGLVGRAVSAGRKALRQAERRVPPDLRRQIERTVKDGQKTVISTIDRLEAQVKRSAKQADVDKVLKRLDGLAKQMQEMARAAASRGATGSAPGRRRTANAAPRAATTAKTKTRRAATTPKRKVTTAKRSSARKAAAPRAAAQRSSPRRTPSRRASAPSPGARGVPKPPAPGPIPESVDTGESPA